MGKRKGQHGPRAQEQCYSIRLVLISLEIFGNICILLKINFS